VSGWKEENCIILQNLPDPFVEELLRTLFFYKFSFFPEMKIPSLLKKIKISAVRPVVCTIKGKLSEEECPVLSGEKILSCRIIRV
jgi:hypothetical protein